MATLTAAVIVDMWEQGLALDAVQRPVALLAIANPDADFDTFARLSIGQRDAALLHLRERLFGATLTTMTHCDVCGEVIETSFATHDIAVEQPETAAADGLQMQADGYAVNYRPLNSYDLSAVTGGETTLHDLVTRAVVSASYDGQACSVADLPHTVVQNLSEALEESDPQANVQLMMMCPACEHQMAKVFDIATYLWQEIEGHARALLLEVHALAKAYGWGERDILTMSTWRRRQYLELIHG